MSDESTPSHSDFTVVGKADEIPEGEGRAYEIDGKLVAVFKHGGKFFSIEDQCPHMGASLATGFLENGAVACPWHAWRFDISNGAWCDNPRVKLDAYEVRVVDGELLVSNTPKKIAD